MNHLRQFVEQNSKVFKFRQAVKRLAMEHDADSAVVVIALADVLGDIAALQDKQGGKFSLKDRLDSFCERVEQTYDQQRHTMETARVDNGVHSLKHQSSH